VQIYLHNAETAPFDQSQTPQSTEMMKEFRRNSVLLAQSDLGNNEPMCSDSGCDPTTDRDALAVDEVGYLC
jgi:hypothetical protein